MDTLSVIVWAALALVPVDEPRGGAKLLDQLDTCRAIAVDADRLRCFDAAAAAVVDARAKKEIVVLDKAEVRSTKRSLFGFSLPSIRLFGDGKDDDALKQVTGTLRDAASTPGGGLRFTLQNDGEAAGGVWETTESATVMPRKGDVVTIQAGPFGSYVATAPKRRPVRVRRVR